jgi:alpha-glucuronidase
VFRPFGIRVYLSPRFSAPIELGKLPTADPLDPAVIEWWKQKADEIYKLIPDFGGFLVKANSEGQPGPRTYNRTHADGANMLAKALAPHHGIVMWRAFVYDMKPGYDRAGAAYENLQPFDGKFAPNVLLQVKNGPIDFQPREPFHPLFGAMPRTQLMPELQLTQEYLGFDNHFVFLASMWREFLDSDTYARGRGSTVSKVVDGELFRQRLTGIAGVANTGSDTNWTGYDLLQANWYAFGRLAWDPQLSSEQIATEWTRMTLTQYRPEVARQFGTVDKCPEKYLLWFHHVPWNFLMRSGDVLWEEMARHYQSGIDWVRSTRATWATLSGVIDSERHAAISKKLAIQERDAVWWRDACLLYFQTFSKQPLPKGVEPPAKTLSEYKEKALDW